MKQNERVVKFFYCSVTSSVRANGSSSSVSPVTLLDALLEMQRLVKSGVVISTATVGDALQWKLVDVDIDQKKGKAIILINRSDADSANQAIEDRIKGSLRVVTKDLHEAYAYSAHIAFKLNRNSAGRYPMLIEQAGVSSARISNLLKRGVRASQDSGSLAFMYPHPDGVLVNKKIKYLKGFYDFDLNGKPSVDFLKQLDRGVMTDIELIQEPKIPKHWDTYNATQERSLVVRLKPIRKKVKNTDVIFSLLDEARRKKQGELVVKFKDEEGDSRTLVWDVDSKLLSNEDRFVERQYLRNFQDSLDSAYSAINVEIRDRMYALLK